MRIQASLPVFFDVYPTFICTTPNPFSIPILLYYITVEPLDQLLSYSAGDSNKLHARVLGLV
jgi:hypothetical protein